MAGGVKGSFMRRRPSFVVWAFRRLEASRRRGRGFCGVVVVVVVVLGGGVVERDFVKWERRVWSWVVFERRVVFSGSVGDILLEGVEVLVGKVVMGGDLELCFCLVEDFFGSFLGRAFSVGTEVCGVHSSPPFQTSSESLLQPSPGNDNCVDSIFPRLETQFMLLILQILFLWVMRMAISIRPWLLSRLGPDESVLESFESCSYRIHDPYSAHSRRTY